MCRVISAVLPECKLLESARPDNGDTLFLPIFLNLWMVGNTVTARIQKSQGTDSFSLT